jgi:hypothetical protein
MPGGCSSIGRAPALQAGGHRFDPGQLHQLTIEIERNERMLIDTLPDVGRQCGAARFRGPLKSRMGAEH